MQTIDITPPKPAKPSLVISTELKNHYDLAIEFRDSLLDGENKVLSKNSDIVSAMNSVTKILTELTRQLEKAHSAENFAAMKQILIATLKEVDRDVAEKFMKSLREKNL